MIYAMREIGELYLLPHSQELSLEQSNLAVVNSHISLLKYLPNRNRTSRYSKDGQMHKWLIDLPIATSTHLRIIGQ